MCLKYAELTLKYQSVNNVKKITCNSLRSPNQTKPTYTVWDKEKNA